MPFVAKATGVAVAKIGAKVMAGAKLSAFRLDDEAVSRHVAVKESVFPFARFPNVDVLLGPEMKSTGEVMGLDASFERAFAKSQLGAGVRLPLAGTAFISVKDGDKPAAVALARRLTDMGFGIAATRGTAAAIREAGLEVGVVNKVLEGRPHCVDAIKSGAFQLVINTTSGGRSVSDSFDIRRSALTHNVPHYTTLAGARAAVHAIAALKAGTLEVAPSSRILSGRSRTKPRACPGNRGRAASFDSRGERGKLIAVPAACCAGYTRREFKRTPAVQKFPMTAEGLARLEEELRHLKSVERPAVIRSIAEARTHGDLSENAEYHAARERQSFIEGRVAELEAIIAAAEVIDISKLSGNQVMFGAKVTLVDEETEEERTWQIVGAHEADIKKGLISISSPVARAILGKKVGDVVEVPAPGGAKSYEITAVGFG